MDPNQDFHLLIVDDDRGVTRAVERQVEFSLGWKTTVASDGIEALELTTDLQCISMVLSDIQMPRMDGLRFYSALLQTRPQLAAAFGFMSGGTSNDRIMKGVESSERPFLPKPFDQTELIDFLIELAASQGNHR